MTLIVILLVLASERYWRTLDVHAVFAIVVALATMLLRRFGQAAWFNSSFGVLLVIMPLVMVTAVVQTLLAAQTGVLIWLLSLLFALLVLIISIGEKRFSLYVKQYLDAWARGDLEAACRYLNEMTLEEVELSNPRQLNHKFMEVFLGRINERLLAILFWFVVLGPMGAVLYRSVAQLKGLSRTAPAAEGFTEAAIRLKLILDWLPARLTALCYAMIGSFVDAIHTWREQAPQWADDWQQANRGVLTSTGLGALQIQEYYTDKTAEIDNDTVCQHVEHAHALIRRTVIAWLTVLALMTLAGWLS